MATESFVHEKTLKDIDKKIINNVLLVLTSFWAVAKSTPKLIVDTIFGNFGNEQSQNNSGGVLSGLKQGINDTFSQGFGGNSDESKAKAGNNINAKKSGISKDLNMMFANSGGAKSKSKTTKSTGSNPIQEMQEHRRVQEMMNQNKPQNHPANQRMPGQLM